MRKMIGRMKNYLQLNIVNRQSRRECPHRATHECQDLCLKAGELDAPAARLNRNGDEFEVISRKGVAPCILDVQSTRRFSGALVHDLQALFSARKKMIFSPLAQ